jgi:2-succinyl-5-enolpyruvyl-6-hydroxy-3-cyclohexene-1-carboxylate synthase
MIIPSLIELVSICHSKQVRHIVISPGSRNAALTIAFVRYPEIKTYIISDERSAAFIAMGMAQSFLQKYESGQSDSLEMVAILCTSGSASINYYPAIAEAYYQRTPLMVLTADRPIEWVDQQDGQTIRQSQIYQNHIAASFNLLATFQHPDSVWYNERIVNEAINKMQTALQPVHLNIPIREPFYPTSDEKMVFNSSPRIIDLVRTQPTLDSATWNQLMDIWHQYENKLIVVGQNLFSPTLLRSFEILQTDYSIPVVGDSIANIHSLRDAITNHDLFLNQLSNEEKENLRPDLLITVGKSILSKSLKQFLKLYKPRYHWRIDYNPELIDTFQNLTHHIPVTGDYFFNKLLEDLDLNHPIESIEVEEAAFYLSWQDKNRKSIKNRFQFDFQKEEFSEIEIIDTILDSINENVLMHLANSMPVRYINYLGLSHKPNIQVFANRGTSGIDGSSSTAVGAALANPDEIVVLITGDLAFFYDRNAYWHNYPMPNLRIILLNNHGGNIFRIIDGPRELPELEEYFETNQSLNAKNTAQDFGMKYFHAFEREALQNHLMGFFAKSNKIKILEIETSKKNNAIVFDKFRAIS